MLSNPSGSLLFRKVFYSSCILPEPTSHRHAPRRLGLSHPSKASYCTSRRIIRRNGGRHRCGVQQGQEKWGVSTAEAVGSGFLVIEMESLGTKKGIRSGGFGGIERFRFVWKGNQGLMF